jgi:hypothetical protein
MMVQMLPNLLWYRCSPTYGGTDSPQLIMVQMLPNLWWYRCSPTYDGTDAPQLIMVQMLLNLLWYRCSPTYYGRCSPTYGGTDASQLMMVQMLSSTYYGTDAPQLMMVQMLPNLLHHQLTTTHVFHQYTIRKPHNSFSERACLEYILLFISPFCVWSICFYFHVAMMLYTILYLGVSSVFTSY